MADDHAYGLTRLQRDCLLVIQEMIDTTGMSPSLEELRQELDLGTRSQVHRALRALRDRGYVDWLDNTARSIAVKHRIPYPQDLAYELSQLDAGVVAEAAAP